MFGCSELRSRLTRVSRSMSPRRVQLASTTGFANFVVSEDRRSLDDGSSGNARARFCYASSRVDYCNAVHAGAPKTFIDMLQRVLNAAARVGSDTRKFDRGLMTLLNDECHQLDVANRVTYKLGVMMYRCLHGRAPRYLADFITPASNVASRLLRRSADRHQFIVPHSRLNTRPSGVFD